MYGWNYQCEHIKVYNFHREFAVSIYLQQNLWIKTFVLFAAACWLSLFPKRMEKQLWPSALPAMTPLTSDLHKSSQAPNSGRAMHGHPKPALLPCTRIQKSFTIESSCEVCKCWFWNNILFCWINDICQMDMNCFICGWPHALIFSLCWKINWITY